MQPRNCAVQGFELMRCRYVGPNFRYGGSEEVRTSAVNGGSSAQVLI